MQPFLFDIVVSKPKMRFKPPESTAGGTAFEEVYKKSYRSFEKKQADLFMSRRSIMGEPLLDLLFIFWLIFQQ